MNFMIPVLLTSLLTVQSTSPPRTDEEGRAYFEKLYQDRATITCGYVEYTVIQDKLPKQPDLEGSVRTYRLWFDKDRRRIDLSEVRPKDPKKALNSRYSFTDGVHRVIDIDQPSICVREYTSTYLNGKETPGGPATTGILIDPRLIGIIGMEFGLLQHHQLDELKRSDPKATVQVRRALGDEKTELIVSYPNESAITYVLSAGSMLPVKITTRFAKNFPDGRPAPVTRVEVESEVVAMPNSRGERFDFPRTLKIQRITDGQIETAETISIVKADFNIPIDSKDLTWKALNPAKGVELIYNDEHRRAPTTAVSWDGENFASRNTSPFVTPTLDGSPDTVAEGKSSTSVYQWAMLILGIGFAAIFTAVKVFLQQ